MAQQLRVQFKQELTTMHQELEAMGKATTEAITQALKALTTHDKPLAESIIKGDIKINDYELTIEKEVHRLIGLQAPVADELRLLIADLKASADIERIADHAVSISRSVLTIDAHDGGEAIETSLAKIGDEAASMVSDLVKALIDLDSEKAKIIAKQDDAIDSYYQDVAAKTIAAMRKDATLIENGAHYLSIASDLERIADYATNLAERIVFAEEGDWVNLN